MRPELFDSATVNYARKILSKTIRHVEYKKSMATGETPTKSYKIHCYTQYSSDALAYVSTFDFKSRHPVYLKDLIYFFAVKDNGWIDYFLMPLEQNLTELDHFPFMTHSFFKRFWTHNRKSMFWFYSTENIRHPVFKTEVSDLISTFEQNVAREERQRERELKRWRQEWHEKHGDAFVVYKP